MNKKEKERNKEKVNELNKGANENIEYFFFFFLISKGK
jgi:hypothetical protein